MQTGSIPKQGPSRIAVTCSDQRMAQCLRILQSIYDTNHEVDYSSIESAAKKLEAARVADKAGGNGTTLWIFPSGAVLKTFPCGKNFCIHTYETGSASGKEAVEIIRAAGYIATAENKVGYYLELSRKEKVPQEVSNE